MKLRALAMMVVRAGLADGVASARIALAAALAAGHRRLPAGGLVAAGATAASSAPAGTEAGPPRSTHGYWLVGHDGGIFSFGSAQFYGSTGNLHLQRPVVGITPTAEPRRLLAGGRRRRHLCLR